MQIIKTALISAGVCKSVSPASKLYHLLLVALERLGYSLSASFTYLIKLFVCFVEECLRALLAFVEHSPRLFFLLVNQFSHFVAPLANFVKECMHSFATRAHGYSFNGLCTGGGWFGLLGIGWLGWLIAAAGGMLRVDVSCRVDVETPIGRRGFVFDGECVGLRMR